MWQHWVNGLLGLWVLISPFVGFTIDQMTTNLVIVGIVAIIVSIWGAVQANSYRVNEQRHVHV